jgi:hypothetical protein
MLSNYDDRLRLVREIAKVEDVLQIAGIETKGKKYLCPFHDDRDPSATIIKEGRVFRCWGCGKTANAIELVRDLYGVKFKKAVAMLYRGMGHPGWTTERLQRLANRERHDEDKHARRVVRMLWETLVGVTYRLRVLGIFTREEQRDDLERADYYDDLATIAERGHVPTSSYFGLVRILEWLPRRRVRADSGDPAPKT